MKYFIGNGTFKTIKEMNKKELEEQEEKLENDLRKNIKNHYIEENKRIRKQLKEIKQEKERKK